MAKYDTDASFNDKRSPAASTGNSQMTDSSYAQEILQGAFEIGPRRNAKTAMADAFKALKERERELFRKNRDLFEERREWTKRRVRSIWEKTARRIDHYEIDDLTAVAVEEARHERARLKSKDIRLAAFISAAEAGAGKQVDHR